MSTEGAGSEGTSGPDFGALTALPGGLDDMYTTNFGRAFPAGDGGAAWAAARPLVEAVVASRELLPVAVLGAAERAALPAVSLLLPVRRIDGVDRVGVLHKSVKDWLTDAGRAEGFAVEAPPGHALLAAACLHCDAAAAVDGAPLSETGYIEQVVEAGLRRPRRIWGTALSSRCSTRRRTLPRCTTPPRTTRWCTWAAPRASPTRAAGCSRRRR